MSALVQQVRRLQSGEIHISVDQSHEWLVALADEVEMLRAGIEDAFAAHVSAKFLTEIPAAHERLFALIDWTIDWDAVHEREASRPLATEATS